MAESREPGDLSVGAGNDSGRIRQPCDETGQSDAAGHVVVNADHVGTQTRVDRYLVRAKAGPGCEIPIKVGHGNTPGLAPAEPGFGVRQLERRKRVS